MFIRCSCSCSTTNVYSCDNIVFARDGPSRVLVDGGGVGWLIGVVFVVVSWDGVCVDEVPVFEFLGWLLVVEFFVFLILFCVSEVRVFGGVVVG